MWSAPRCDRCGAPASSNCTVCQHCLPVQDATTPPFQIRAATEYTPTIRAAIHALKYQSRPGLAEPLAKLVLAAAPPLFDWNRYSALVPVPLHRARHAERGFNQAQRIAEALAPQVGLPVREWLRRTTLTAPLSRLDGRADRAQAMSGVFRSLVPAANLGARVLVVDDLVTTGATALQAAHTLLADGITGVDVLAVARALLQPETRTPLSRV